MLIFLPLSVEANSRFSRLETPAFGHLSKPFRTMECSVLSRLPGTMDEKFESCYTDEKSLQALK